MPLFDLIKISINPKHTYKTALFSIAACLVGLGLETLYKKSITELTNTILKQAEILEYLDYIAGDLDPEVYSIEASRSLNQAHQMYEDAQTILRTNEVLELFFTVTNILEIYLTSKIAAELSFEMITHSSFSIDKAILCALNMACTLGSTHSLQNKIENIFFQTKDTRFLKLSLKTIDAYIYTQTIDPIAENDIPVAYECSGEDSKLNTTPLAEVVDIS